MGKLIGTTRIELTDVRTGEKEVHEKHNMVTNALRDLFAPIGMVNSENTFFDTMLPYYQKLLGGILLFDKALDEDPDKYFPPADAALIGCGKYDSSTDAGNLYRGSYNSVESELNTAERYVKYVYDYGTTQANGTIASVCLTHYDGGSVPYEALNPEKSGALLVGTFSQNKINFVSSASSGSNNTRDRKSPIRANLEYLFWVNEKEDRVFYFKFTDAKHIHIIKRRAFLKSVNIFDNPKTTKPIADDQELEELTENVSFSYNSYNLDTETNKLYIVTSDKNTITSGESLKILEINLSDWGIKQYSVNNTTNGSIHIDYETIFVTDGYIYVQTTGYNFYKIKIDNPSDVTRMSNTINNNRYLDFQYYINGRIFAESLRSSSSNTLEGGVILNTYTNTVSYIACAGISGNCRSTDSTNMYNNFIPINDQKLKWYLSCETSSGGTPGWYYLKNYLATINNLDVPVTKTAEKTMKITYILQEE